MNRLKTALATGALSVAVTTGALAVSATSASAYVACNHFGECWRVQDRTVVYPGAARVIYHDDNWWDGHHRHGYHWRDNHDGRGYWRRGVWVAF